MLQLLQNTVIIRLGDPLRETAGRLYEHLQRSLQQLILSSGEPNTLAKGNPLPTPLNTYHFSVVVVVVPDPVDALDIVPDRSTELGRVHIRPTGLRIEEKNEKQLIINKPPGARTAKSSFLLFSPLLSFLIPLLLLLFLLPPLTIVQYVKLYVALNLTSKRKPTSLYSRLTSEYP